MNNKPSPDFPPEILHDWEQEHVTLDCGHPPSPHGPHTTGTAHCNDGREICCDCADQEQREEIKTADKYVGYLSSDSQTITTWTGGFLLTITHLWPVLNNFCRRSSRRYGSLLRIRAVAPDGSRWHGTSPSRGMYCRLHRSKSKAK